MNLLEKLRRQKVTSTMVVVLTLMVGILIGTVVNTRWGSAVAQSRANDATPLVVPPVAAIGNEFSQLAKKLEASVVNISVEIKTPAGGGLEAPDGQPVPRPSRPKQVRPGQPQQQAPDSQDGQIPEFFRKFLNPDGSDAPAEEETHQASGTGFIVDKNGYIITNNHVVENATKISVRLHGESTEYKAHVIGTDCESDLAVIKIDAHRPLPTVNVANSDSVQVGDWAVAIGSPFGLEATVTAGIVSATGRGSDQVGSGARAFQSFIQTDAAINPGNSGGPLLNIRGEVIGVNTMIATSSGSSAGVGFALPVNMAVRVFNDIIRYGRVARGSLGVNLAQSNHPDAMLKALGLDHGAVVEKVNDSGPAQAAGLKANDIIVGINGKPVKDNQDLISTVADLPLGKASTLNIDRDGAKLNLQVTAQDRMELYKDNPAVACSVRPAEPEEKQTSSTGPVQFGLEIRATALTDDERKIVPSHKGVLVRSVKTGSFAEQVGLEDNDIIDSINRRPVNSVEDIRQVQTSLKPGDPVAFHVIRQAPQPANGRRRGAAPEPALIYLTDYLPGN
jgi:serine protease Do